MKSAVSLLQPCLLLLLSERPEHGYALIEHLCSFDLVLLNDPGTVYRALHRLERQGLVEARWEPNAAGPARRVYSVTAPGAAALRAWTRELEIVRRILDSYLGRYRDLVDREHPDAPPEARPVP